MKKFLLGLVWLIAAVIFLIMISLPITIQTHLVMVVLFLVTIAALKVLGLSGRWRLIALALGSAIVARYVYWRTTETIPPVSQLEDFIPGLLLYLAEMYSVVMLALSLFIVARPLESREPLPFAAEEAPTVDVFIPTYNEDSALLADTIAAATALDYPRDKLTVWLLDDGGTDQKRSSKNEAEAREAEARREELQALCRNFGVRYLTRPKNEHAKAGNLNYALEHSDGDLIAVFDADHAPARSFLADTVGFFFEDPKLFLVQTPHFFINPDPLERNLQTFEKMPSENEMFYGVIQRGLDKWNASFFCGSAAVLRREALIEADGFSGITITEDCETALELHSRGWNSVYLDKPLIAGLQPATFASFIGQRSRWAQGMMQILIFRFPLLKPGLSIGQRLGYMSSMLFWLFPLARITFLFAPLFYLFFGLQIFESSGGEFFAYTFAYFVVNLIMQNYLYGRFRWPWISELYEYIQSVHLIPAVFSVMFNPRKPTFKVTAKDETITTARLSELSRPFFVIFAFLLVGLGFAVYRYFYADNADITLVVGGWNLFNLIIAGAALGVVAERAERAASRRITISRRCHVDIDGRLLPAAIEDVSVNGARLKLRDTDYVDWSKVEQATIILNSFSGETSGSLPIEIRNYEERGGAVYVGCRYLRSEPAHHALASDLMFANADQWSDFQASRRNNPGVIMGTLWFLKIAFTQTWRGLSYLFRSGGKEERRDNEAEDNIQSVKPAQGTVSRTRADNEEPVRA